MKDTTADEMVQAGHIAYAMGVWVVLKLMQDRGISRKQVCEHLSWSQSMLSNVLTGSPNTSGKLRYDSLMAVDTAITAITDSREGR